MGKKDEDFTNSRAWQNWLSDEPSKTIVHKQPTKKLGLATNLARQPAEQINTIPVAAKRPEQPVEGTERRRPGIDRFAANNAPNLPPVTVRTRVAAQKRSVVSSIRARTGLKPLESPEKPSKPEVRPLVSVQIAVPQIKLPKFDIRRYQPTPMQIRVLLAVVGTAALIVGGWFAVLSLSKTPAETAKKPSTTATVSDELSFVPVAPAGKGAISPENKNASYDTAKNFYQYQEQHEGVAITVNEQPLPEKLKKKSELDKLVKSMDATESFTTTLGTVHITPTKGNGPQRLVLSNSYMLMFIQSTDTLSNQQWVTYIESFERII